MASLLQHFRLIKRLFTPKMPPNFPRLPTGKFQWLRHLLWILVFLLFYTLLRHLMQGDVLKEHVPPVKLTTLTGKTYDLSQPQPKPYLIHFWGTWCPICNYQHDTLRHLSEDYTVIAVAFNSMGDDALASFAQSNDLPLNIIVNDLDTSFAEKFHVSVAPTDFYVLPNGKIRIVETGYTSYFGYWIRMWWLTHFASEPSSASTQTTAP